MKQILRSNSGPLTVADLGAQDAAEHISFDYTRQAWVVDGRYMRCGHHESMNCACYGKVHAGELAVGKLR